MVNHHPVHSANIKGTMAAIKNAKYLLGWEPMLSAFKGHENIIKHPELLQFEI